ncbi:MAG: hypothetical protein LRS49_01510 [Desulfurococcales archaeon]|nr:hypothetical protein [Desulfurococcales archaeon]
MQRPEQRGGRLSPEAALLARRLSTALAAPAGLHEAPTPRPHPLGPRPGGDPWAQAAGLAYLVEAARRGDGVEEAVAGIAWWAASATRPGEALRARLAGLRARRVGLMGLLSLAVRHAREGSAESLERLAAALAGELSRPCGRDRGLEMERGRLERGMKRLGLMLGVTLPALFVASLLYNPLLALASLAGAAAVWAAVLRLGSRFREAVVECEWSACTLSREELLDIASGRDLPSAAEMLGVRSLGGVAVGGKSYTGKR